MSNEKQIESIEDVAEHIRKRMRNLTKRKQKLEKYEEILSNGEGDSKLDEYQREALAHKKEVLLPLKELEDVQTALHELQIAEESQRKETEKAAAAIAKAEYHRGYDAAVEDSKKKILLLSQFLRDVSVRRVLTAEEARSPEDIEIDAAFEKVLHAVYCGNSSAVDTILKLINEDSDYVPETSVTYKKIAEEVKMDSEPVDIAESEGQSEKPETHNFGYKRGNDKAKSNGQRRKRYTQRGGRGNGPKSNDNGNDTKAN
ncbi:hypothetical protein CANCADRAFT_31719 [Tortispora caseinolytica NRRL Y-17796]|uniref:YAG7-like dimerisation domain-containing protein n=1 Tax=Tortispora caseinolytica NRRL Y-17796 TaxID=767744 RepID=A0A1E4TGM7_9ASCO|nr:hypothetical protein CANCADRAFT_31719 [Tortispora caseinolytica NRRL Y-17796]